MYTKKIVFIILLCLSSLFSFAQLRVSEHTIQWYEELKKFAPDTQDRIAFKHFVRMDKFQELPCYATTLQELSAESDANLYLGNEQIRLATPKESAYLKTYDHIISSDFIVECRTQEYKYKFQLDAFVFPIRKNPNTGNYELLTNFNLLSNTKDKEVQSILNQKRVKPDIKNESVLASAPFFKMRLQQSGIYRLTFTDMIANGILQGPVSSSQIALFGNPSGMVSKNNAAPYYDDLTEIPIAIYDGGDGSFDANDYLLFYASAPITWQWNSNVQNPDFAHQMNYYDDYTYYFLSANYTQGERKRIEDAREVNQVPQNTIRHFIDYLYYEKELSNPCNIGLNWMGENFRENGASNNLDFVFPDAVLDSAVQVKLAVAANGAASFIFSATADNALRRSFTTNRMENGAEMQSVELKPLKEKIAISESSNCLSTAFVRYACKIQKINPRFVLSFEKQNSTASVGYLDYFSSQYYRNLKLSQGKLNFRSVEAVNQTVKFQIDNLYGKVQVWKVDTLWNIQNIKVKAEEGKFSFVRNDDHLAEFVAFDGSSFLSVQSTDIQKIDTQNLHGLSSIEYVIVTPSNFREQADSLANLHRQNNLKTAVVLDAQVYNEFSSGVADPSAIRRFMKMLYDKAKENTDLTPPSYLLLYGDASYDVKNILGKKSNFIPTFESNAYWDIDGAKDVTDDYFAYLGDNESSSGGSLNGIIDIAVGRLPVSNQKQAKDVLEKIKRYMHPYLYKDISNVQQVSNFGDWRNTILFSSDDGESFDEFYEDSVRFASRIYLESPQINIQKIYSDAYQRFSTPKGATFPDARKALHERMDKGALFVGYMGHSGWDAWSDEKLLILEDIYKWKNYYALPMMFSSSCTFAYFDQVDQLSGGELCVLTPNGGAISMIAASRVVFVGDIENIQSDFIIHALKKQDGIPPSIGDAYLYAKMRNNTPGTRPFVLLGDPALKVALPLYDVKTTHINGKELSQGIVDTLKAFSQTEVEGEILLADGTVHHAFNGILQVQIFDKMTEEKTRGNQHSKGNYNAKVPYKLQQSIIYKGQTKVENGKFKITFIVPKDIAYNYGFGKISYYAYSDSLGDASGYFNGIMVGGFDENSKDDTTPPQVDLFIDAKSFKDGGTVGNKPTIIANIFDDYGINTTGSGIGHDLLLTIDGNIKNNIVLNDLFLYDLGSYTTGSLIYTLPELSPGKHSIELKVWNIYNLSTLTRLNFIVEDPNKFQIFGLFNAPNPASMQTSFYFTHNTDEKLDRVEIEICGLQGNLIGKFQQKMTNISSYVIGPLTWECRSIGGQKLPQGMYFYTIKLYDVKGNMAKAGQKLVIIN